MNADREARMPRLFASMVRSRSAETSYAAPLPDRPRHQPNPWLTRTGCSQPPGPPPGRAASYASPPSQPLADRPEVPELAGGNAHG